MKTNDTEENNSSQTLGFVDLDVAKAAVLATLRSPGSRRCYKHAIDEFICWYCSEPRLGFNKLVVTRYRMHLEARRLAPGTINLRLAAVRRLADLIAGKVDIPISQSRANSIALFAFKTVVVLEHLNRNRPSRFFPRQVRYRFREALELPPNLNIWVARYLPLGQGRCVTVYHDLPAPGSLELYVCSYAIGHFVFQAVAERQPSSFALSPIPGFEHLAVPLWPCISPGFMWPPKAVLKTIKDFDFFATRWRRLNASKPFGD